MIINIDKLPPKLQHLELGQGLTLGANPPKFPTTPTQLHLKNTEDLPDLSSTDLRSFSWHPPVMEIMPYLANLGSSLTNLELGRNYSGVPLPPLPRIAKLSCNVDLVINYFSEDEISPFLTHLTVLCTTAYFEKKKAVFTTRDIRNEWLWDRMPDKYPPSVTHETHFRG